MPVPSQLQLHGGQRYFPKMATPRDAGSPLRGTQGLPPSLPLHPGGAPGDYSTLGFEKGSFLCFFLETQPPCSEAAQASPRGDTTQSGSGRRT